MAQKSALLMGAGRVIAVDRLAYRLEFARTYNGVETVDFSAHADPVAHLKDLCGGRGSDVAIDAIGLEADGSVMHGILGRKLKLQAGAATVIDWAIGPAAPLADEVRDVLERPLLARHQHHTRPPRCQVLGRAATDPGRGAGGHDDLLG